MILPKFVISKIVFLLKIVSISIKLNLLSCFNYLDEVRDHRNGKLNLVLPKNIGENVFTNECELDEIKYGFIKLSRLLSENNKRLIN